MRPRATRIRLGTMKPPAACAPCHPARAARAHKAEYTEARRLTMPILCSVYGIPLQLMSGDSRNLDAAQRGLLTNSLAPWLALIAEAANRDLVLDVHGEEALFGRIFAEYILEEKSRGSFSQQAQILERASGGSAWMTPNRSGPC